MNSSTVPSKDSVVSSSFFFIATIMAVNVFFFLHVDTLNGVSSNACTYRTDPYTRAAKSIVQGPRQPTILKIQSFANSVHLTHCTWLKKRYDTRKPLDEAHTYKLEEGRRYSQKCLGRKREKNVYACVFFFPPKKLEVLPTNGQAT